jgi:hypothetical protein
LQRRNIHIVSKILKFASLIFDLHNPVCLDLNRLPGLMNYVCFSSSLSAYANWWDRMFFSFRTRYPERFYCILCFHSDKAWILH